MLAVHVQAEILIRLYRSSLAQESGVYTAQLEVPSLIVACNVDGALVEVDYNLRTFAFLVYCLVEGLVCELDSRQSNVGAIASEDEGIALCDDSLCATAFERDRCCEVSRYQERLR